jgi:hypothetical protein
MKNLLYFSVFVMRACGEYDEVFEHIRRICGQFFIRYYENTWKVIKRKIGGALHLHELVLPYSPGFPTERNLCITSVYII